MLKAPAFLFPTSALMVDDDAIYAHLLADRVKSQITLFPLSKPDYLLENSDKDFIFSPNSDEHNEFSLEKMVHACMHDKKNYLSPLVSNVIVDLHMDNLTGLELIYQIKSPFVYKILISNFIDCQYHDEIKHAQNKGLIHSVLEKGSHLAEELPKAMFHGQLRFFSMLSNKIFSDGNCYPHLSDTLLAQHFLELIERFEPHCIWPNKDLNSFTFEGPRFGQKTGVSITTDEEIRLLLEGENAYTAPPKTLEQLKSGNFMLIADNPHEIDGSDWPQFIRPARKISGSKSTFIYNVTQESELWAM